MAIKEQKLRIIIGIIGIVVFGVGLFGLFGLVKPFTPQTKTQGEVIGITTERVTNSSDSIVATFTIEFVVEGGAKLTDTVRGNTTLYKPFEKITVRYFNDTLKVNFFYTGGWKLFGIMTPFGTVIIILAIFAVGKK